ncbi:MAG: DUF4878 domain-containing protein, partial [Dehalococcoidia bacterium]|nr:DUF4878 domain-containing protein [Dehalococcoidia bacterium]
AGFMLANKGIGLPSAGSGNSGEGSSSSAVIQVPDGPKIKLINSGLPKGLTLDWEGPMEVDDLGNLKLKGILQNSPDQKVVNGSITFLLDGNNVGRYPIYGAINLAPGENHAVRRGLSLFLFSDGNTIKAKVLEAVFTAEIIPALATPIAKTPVLPNSNKIFTKAPANPQTPEEVVAAFAFLSDQKAYSKAEGLYTEKFMKEYGTPENFWGYIAQKASLTKVEILDTREKPEEADLHVIFYFSNGRSFKSNPTLIKEDGKWKINQ